MQETAWTLEVSTLLGFKAFSALFWGENELCLEILSYGCKELKNKTLEFWPVTPVTPLFFFLHNSLIYFVRILPPAPNDKPRVARSPVPLCERARVQNPRAEALTAVPLVFPREIQWLFLMSIFIRFWKSLEYLWNIWVNILKVLTSGKVRMKDGKSKPNLK